MENYSLIERFSKERFSPLGIFPLQFSDVKKQCDYFYLGKCLNWKWRPSECSRYFCDEGLKAPFESGSENLFEVEFQVAQWALLRQGYKPQTVEGFVDEWNSWAQGKSMSHTGLSVDEALNLYRAIWIDLRALTFKELKAKVGTLEINELDRFYECD